MHVTCERSSFYDASASSPVSGRIHKKKELANKLSEEEEQKEITQIGKKMNENWRERALVSVLKLNNFKISCKWKKD